MCNVLQQPKETFMEDQEKYDRTAELRAFDETKAGVQGLVVSRCNKVPQMFIVPTQDRIQPVDPSNVGTEIPIINIGSGNRQEVVESVRVACEKWGFLQVVGHAVPQNVMDGILCVVRDFHEEGGKNGLKRLLYSRDPKKAVKYNSNFNLYESPVATWRDTLFCRIMSDQSVPDELPDSYKQIFLEYSKHVMNLGTTLFEILSEALGLKSTYLADIECNTHGQVLLCHCYPPCPEPELTIGSIRHSDAGFLTILLQDNIGGLQIIHDGKWIDVPCINGAFILNIGDLMQLISNDKFKSVEHRVVTKTIGPRVSVACLFGTDVNPSSTRIYGPIKELLSKDNLPLYRETKASDFMASYYKFSLDRKSGLSEFRISR